ncbi:MAG TPA: hypothetical protein VEF33_12840 [Syntrophales bacterium]|nr:hypothetical protein [Syntrophales bacterium]
MKDILGTGKAVKVQLFRSVISISMDSDVADIVECLVLTICNSRIKLSVPFVVMSMVPMVQICLSVFAPNARKVTQEFVTGEMIKLSVTLNFANSSEQGCIKKGTLWCWILEKTEADI